MRTHIQFDDLLDDLSKTLVERNRAIVSAPPGAGKTTRIPPALLDADWLGDGQILVLEPRRVAARAAASFMARQRGERLGQSIGYRVRLDSKMSDVTKVAVVTEGIFLRQILSDPMLDGVAAVIFDEFHERSLDADLSLALCLECQQALRPDLKLIVMSATLDVERFSALLEHPPALAMDVRQHPITMRYLGRDRNARIEEQMAKAVLRALREEEGSILAFLPGQAEIRRTLERLQEGISDPDILLTPLYGGLDAQAQDAAIAPAPKGKRKVVLTTAIAQTSLTIEGVRIVIDSGLSRLPRFNPATGLTQLVTERVSAATAEQRRGRAGRLGPGVCYRLWEEAENRALIPHDKPEILSADLTPLALALADWGVDDPAQLKWMDPPPSAALHQARALLHELDAIDGEGRITASGRRLSALPLHPRLAHMIVAAAQYGAVEQAALIAAMLSEARPGPMDAELRLEQFLKNNSPHARAARDHARQWVKTIGLQGAPEKLSIGGLISLAYPDRIAMARSGRPGHFLLANGRGAYVDEKDALARKAFLCVASLTGAQEASRILLAAELPYKDIQRLHGHHFKQERVALYDDESGAVKTFERTTLHALILKDQAVPTDAEDAAWALKEAVLHRGLGILPWPKHMKAWRARLSFLHAAEPDIWPDLSDAALLARAEEWLEPVLASCTRFSDIDKSALASAVQALLPWQLPRRMDGAAPTHFVAPTGFRHPIDYEAEGGPAVALRVQELFGLKDHPIVAGQPLTLILLSPAQRPIQITKDLPGFWAGSYAAVRADMRGRYPKHPWPEDPLSEPPTRRAKPRGL